MYMCILRARRATRNSKEQYTKHNNASQKSRNNNPVWKTRFTQLAIVLTIDSVNRQTDRLRTRKVKEKQMRLVVARHAHTDDTTENADAGEGTREGGGYTGRCTVAPRLSVHAVLSPKNTFATLYTREDRAVFHSERERHWQCREAIVQHSFTASPGPAGSKESDVTSR